TTSPTAASSSIRSRMNCAARRDSPTKRSASRDRSARRTTESMQWRRVAESDLEGFTSAELRAIAALWKNADRRLDVRFGGASMQPTIAPGDTLTLHCTDDVAPGDVIVYVFLDQIIAHRLLIRRGDWFLTRGDAHTVPDPPQ